MPMLRELLYRGLSRMMDVAALAVALLLAAAVARLLRWGA
jgi:hypothetical protein